MYLLWSNLFLQVADMLLELCVTELEDVALDTESGRSAMQPVIQESPHPYADDTITSGHVKIPGRFTQKSSDDPSGGVLF